MQKKTPDYDNVFKTMKSKHKRLFISVINDIFGKDYPMDAKVDVLPSEGYLTESESPDGNREILLRRLNIAISYLPKPPSATLSSIAVALATA